MEVTVSIKGLVATSLSRSNLLLAIFLSIRIGT